MSSSAGGCRTVVGLLLGSLLSFTCGGPPPGSSGEPGADAGAGKTGASSQRVLRVGHFPNLTHVHGVIAHGFTRTGKGWFEQRLPGVTLEWFVYNAGPSAMEAMLAGTLDLTYVGPNPAINAFVRSEGEEVRIVAGATEGGAALVVQGDGRIRGPGDFRGKRVATPQLGNTQDVACRAWLKQQGYAITQTGGDVTVLPTANPDQLTLFLKREIDAAWTVEPWVSRLIAEAGAVPLVEEPDAVTTVLVASARILRDDRDLVRRFAAAHAELTAWIQETPGEAQRMLREELKAETTIEVKAETVSSAWKRFRIVDEVSAEELARFVTAAKAAGFIGEAVDLSRLVEKP